MCSRELRARRGEAGQGKARQGKERQGRARHPRSEDEENLARVIKLRCSHFMQRCDTMSSRNIPPHSTNPSASQRYGHVIGKQQRRECIRASFFGLTARVADNTEYLGRTSVETSRCCPGSPSPRPSHRMSRMSLGPTPS